VSVMIKRGFIGWCLFVLLSLMALLGGCEAYCDQRQTCDDCTDSGCLWVEWQDGATECLPLSEESELPPADSAITELPGDCS